MVETTRGFGAADFVQELIKRVADRVRGSRLDWTGFELDLFLDECEVGVLRSLAADEEPPFSFARMLWELLETPATITPQDPYFWYHESVADRMILQLKGIPQNGRAIVVSGSLRPELFDDAKVVAAFRQTLARGAKVTVIAGPDIQASSNSLLKLISDHPSFEFVLARRRWETHGFFSQQGVGCFELPHTEVEDYRRASVLGDAAAHFRFVEEQIRTAVKNGWAARVDTMTSLKLREIGDLRRERRENVFNDDSMTKISPTLRGFLLVKAETKARQS